MPDSSLDRRPSQTDSSLSPLPQTDSSLSKERKDSHALALQAGDEQQPQQPAAPDAERRPPATKDRPEKDAGASPPPIRITRSPDGRLIISSKDTRALDLLEDMMTRTAPPRKDYTVFHLKYADAYWVKLNLEEYFEDDSKKNDRRSSFFYWFWDDYSSDNKDKTRRLSKRRPLRFIYDSDTNTILVQGGDTQQLNTVKELIELYDQPEPTDSKSLRKSQVFQIQYGKAKVIGDTVKDVYRDLLSENDKALMEGGQQQRRETRYTYITSFGDESAQKIPRFKGALSIGVDELSNTLVVSAQPYLLSEIGTLIEELDELAKPVTPSVHVMSVQHLSSPDIEALSKALGEAAAKKPAAGAGAQRPKQTTPNHSHGR